MDVTPDESSEPAESTIDLQELRDLLVLLTEFKVHVFSMGNLSLGFKDETPPTYSVRHVNMGGKGEDGDDEDRPVRGFTTEGQGFKDPRLWPSQNGRPISFTG